MLDERPKSSALTTRRRVVGHGVAAMGPKFVVPSAPKGQTYVILESLIAEPTSPNPQAFGSAILVRSERQAEEWSVVLLSQGIESLMQPGVENGQWLLIVDKEEYTRALRVLRLYITENKRPVWVQAVPWSGGLVFDWRSPIWFLMLVALFYFEALRPLGVVDSGKVQDGEWWRLFTDRKS